MSPAETSRPSKRKWDQPAPGEDGTTPKAAKTDESKTASEAAQAAAAIAAKIAAQFASGALGSGDKDHDAEFMQDIDINDVRNRYLLTRGSTQDQVCNVVFSYRLSDPSRKQGGKRDWGKAYDVCILRFMMKLELRWERGVCGTQTDQKQQRKIRRCIFTYQHGQKPCWIVL